MLNDNEFNSKIYTELLARHGDSHLSVGWGSEENQNIRFKTLAEIGIRSGDSILDLGCGISHFYRYLKSVGLSLEYTGIDITAAMAERSAKIFPECRFIHGDLSALDIEDAQYDYVFANGIFVFRKERPERYMLKTVEKMFSLARRGVAFSSLSAWGDNKAEGEFHADPLQVLGFCRGLSRYVTLRHDYHPADFIIHIKKA